MDKNTNEKYMLSAIEEAQLAFECGEVPIGAVIVLNGVIVGRGHNSIETEKDATMHAEMKAIQQACKNIGDWRLNGASIYVNVEPCIMCMSACILSRIENVYYGCKQDNLGGSIIIEMDNNRLNLPYKLNIIGGIFENESREMVQRFFRNVRRREEKENRKRNRRGKKMEVRYICPTAYDSSVYLVNGKVLIDAGMNSDLIIRELEKSIKLTDLELIILTHCHYDHTAAASAIVEKSGAKVGVHRADLEGVNDEYLSVSVLFGERAPAVRPTVIY